AAGTPRSGATTAATTPAGKPPANASTKRTASADALWYLNTPSTSGSAATANTAPTTTSSASSNTPATWPTAVTSNTPPPAATPQAPAARVSTDALWYISK
ncbi:lytic transglycosylase, partial [Paraburkholderia sp. SIMBA_050]